MFTNQSHSHLEIVAVDDCSVDSSWHILSEYKRRYPCFRIYQNESNLGHTKNFEKALSLCNGEFIALCDQDDIWHYDKLKLQLANIATHQLIYHDSAFMDHYGNLINKKMSDVINLYSGDNSNVFLFLNCVSGHSCFFRKTLLDVILPFHPNHFHDHWIAYVAANIGTVHYISECLVNYRQHPDSSTDILNKRKILDRHYHENRDIKKLEKELYCIQKKRKSKRNAFIYRQIWGLKSKLLWSQIFGKSRS
ncbi:glycosyltransferase [Dyadobacter fanqingshengii]|uniref:glycosyltransferase n=1 Tax=Dyadobacter fanqingshengii TaxID=2906443 RepID=UPI00286E5BBE|nr:glycosyltransferase [Dyadobacter fanqingshengii]